MARSPAHPSSSTNEELRQTAMAISYAVYQMIPKSVKQKLQQRKARVREKTIEEYLVEVVEIDLGGKCYKLIGFDFTGFPDRTVLLPGGRIYFIELKAPRKKPKPRQGVIRDVLVKLGFNWRVIDSLKGVERFKKEVIG